MTSPSKSSPVIVLAAVDDTAVAEDVLRTAGGLASANPGAEIHLLQVVVPPTPPIDGMVYVMAYGPTLADLIAVAKEELANIVASSLELLGKAPICHVLAGAAGREIVDLARTLGADVIVVGPHAKRALSRVLLGSVSEYVVRHAPCSVLVARAKEAVSVPQIEPPCPACLDARAAGDVMAWCERHSKHHARANLHYEAPPSFGVGSMFIRPEG